MGDEKIKQLPPVRRVVTGHDAQGRSVIAMDDMAPVAFAYAKSPDFGSLECWRTTEMPVDNARPGDACVPPFGATLPHNGSTCRIVQFPPDSTYRDQWARDGGMHGVTGSGHDGKVRRTSMHRTPTLDYVIVLEGEIHAVMEAGETKLVKGDVLVQRGTDHAWSNRSDRNCILAVVMLDAVPMATG